MPSTFPNHLHALIERYRKAGSDPREIYRALWDEQDKWQKLAIEAGKQDEHDAIYGSRN